MEFLLKNQSFSFDLLFDNNANLSAAASYR